MSKKAEKVIKQFDNAKSWEAVTDIWDTGRVELMTYYTEDGDIPEELPVGVYWGMDIKGINCLKTMVYADQKMWDREIIESGAASGFYDLQIDDQAEILRRHIERFVYDNAEQIAEDIERELSK